MVSIGEAIILGIVQGVTEWLPISSSGHLVLMQQLFNIEVPLIYDIILHLGTLIALFIVFWKEIVGMTRAVLTFDKNNPSFRFAIFILLGSIPTAIIGFLFQDLFASFFTSLLVVGIGLLITGTLLFFSRFADGKKGLTLWHALCIGTAQGIAIIPGISRSGITIATGLFQGMEKELAAKFSFLLSIPAVGGAFLLRLTDLEAVSSQDYLPYFFGLLAATIVGYYSLKLLLHIVVKRKFHTFCWYCWPVGLLAILLYFFG
ncbi:undecaprenyl-diphosphate phosphatase [Candidatus Woesearchaeota archaeon]|nr:undecaprenyl-diphosphate phosphatase [Candidatus Woesearchaeota archaeon]